MDFYKIFYVLLLCCVVDQGLAWFGGGGDSKSKDTSKKSNDKSSGSASKSRGSGWWGGSKDKPSKPKAKPQPKPPAPKPKPPAPKPKPRDPPAPKPKPSAPKPKPKPEEKRKSGWWSGKDRNVPSKPKTEPKPEPPKNTESKPKKSGWWSSSGKDRNVPPKPKPKPSIPGTKKGTDPKPDSTPKKPTETDMKGVIEKFEGVELKAYDAQPKNPKVHDTTIGIGFNLNRPDARTTFEKLVPGKDFEKVKSGKETITKTEARALFDHDVDKIYEPRARDKVGADVYDKLPSNVKTAVVNAVYRGDLGPKTTKLIKEGKWNEVGKEYLDHNQYKNAEKLGIPGVKDRMDWNKEQFDTMIKSDKATP